MVLCASNEEHTVVQLVDPPAGSRPGDRVTFKGFDGEPANPAQMAKKKIFEKLAPQVIFMCSCLCVSLMAFFYFFSHPNSLEQTIKALHTGAKFRLQLVHRMLILFCHANFLKFVCSLYFRRRPLHCSKCSERSCRVR